jgi:hypothetical protein
MRIQSQRIARKEGGRGMRIRTREDLLGQAGKWVRYKRHLPALIMLVALALATSASAQVIINTPSNGATVSGTVTVKAQITNACGRSSGSTAMEVRVPPSDSSVFNGTRH